MNLCTGMELEAEVKFLVKILRVKFFIFCNFSEVSWLGFAHVISFCVMSIVMSSY